MAFIRDAYDWIKAHPSASVEDYQIKFSEIEMIWNPYAMKLQQKVAETSDANHEDL